MNFTRRVALSIFWGLAWGPQARANTQAGKKILILGDSLSAEYGLPRGAGWVALLSARLKAERPNWQVENASISGETTSGGQARLQALLQAHQPSVVVIELGANDALRGLALTGTRQNLQNMIEASVRQGARVVLVGMQMPPNFGKRYTQDFATMYADLAKETKCALVPFFLKGIADRPDASKWFQADGIHPTAAGHPILLDDVWPALKPLLLGR